MGTRDGRVDDYIARAAPFARPILARLRAQVHRAVPAVEETVKWGFPNFQHHGLLCSMAAFREHCSFGFWKHRLVLGGAGRAGSMGQFGRIRSLADLPPATALARLLRQAAALNETGVKAPRRRKPRPALRAPPDLAAALRRDVRAAAAWAAFPPGKRRDYLEWIAEARTPATRARRLDTTVSWVAQGKARNWKYEKC